MKYKYPILLVCITLTLAACASEVSEEQEKDKTIPEVIEKELDQITEVNHFEEVFEVSKEAEIKEMLTEDIYELKKSYADQFIPKNAEVMSFARLNENVVIEYRYNQLEYSVLYISHNKKVRKSIFDRERYMMYIKTSGSEKVKVRNLEDYQ